MDWFKELSLIEKIKTYGEIMFSLGSTSGTSEEIKEEIKEMLDIIKVDVDKLQEVSQWIYNSVLNKDVEKNK